MCGRFSLIDNPWVQHAVSALGVKANQLRFSSDIAPGSTISFIYKCSQGRIVADATWWLMLDNKTFKPVYKYSAFNTRSVKLNVPGSLGYHPFRKQRCIIPATAFVEGLGDKKTYHKIELIDGLIAFGGLYQSYFNAETGATHFSASIITLPPLRQWQHIHKKAMPLLLDYRDSALIEQWLDPKFQQVQQFQTLLEPKVQQTQRITKIDKPSRWNAIEKSYLIPAEP